MNKPITIRAQMKFVLDCWCTVLTAWSKHIRLWYNWCGHKNFGGARGGEVAARSANACIHHCIAASSNVSLIHSIYLLYIISTFRQNKFYGICSRTPLANHHQTFNYCPRIYIYMVAQKRTETIQSVKMDVVGLVVNMDAGQHHATASGSSQLTPD